MDKNHHKGLSTAVVDDDETRALLPLPAAEDANLSKAIISENPKRKKVQWLDSCGDNYKLAEILEFQPSDGSDSEEEDDDLCFCRIM